jgi:hypothetical protein
MFLLLAALIAIFCCGQFPPPQAPAPASRPATPATQPGEFQPGVRIDWAARCVRVQARVLDSTGPLEFFACGGGKEHESILLLEARATHIFQALGLIGLTPGKPATWDESGRVQPAQGDLVDLRIEWTHEGRGRNAHWTDWVLDAEYMRRPLPLPLVFAGSLVRPDGQLACEISGAALALVNMPDALLAPTRSRSDRSADLWALPDRRAIPPPETSVTLVFDAARPRPCAIALDYRGDFRVDGRFERPADVADLLRVNSKLGVPPAAIRVNGALAADIRRATADLARSGVSADAFRFEAGAASSAPASAPARP